jgi:hypothetical protein
MRIGFYPIAGALCAALTLLVSLTPDAYARPHHRVHSTHFAPAKISSPTLNQNTPSGVQTSGEHTAPNAGITPDRPNDQQAGRNSVGVGQGGNEGAASSVSTGAGTKETNLPNMKDLGPVDTSITIVRPRLQGAKAEVTRQGASKITSKTGKYSHGRRTFARHKSSPVVRNTIGVPIVPRDVATRQYGVPGGTPAGNKPGAEKVVVRAGPVPGPAGLFHPNAGVGRGEGFASHGAISGSTVPHRGFVPATLGGRTKMTGALSGSMIRPKY